MATTDKKENNNGTKELKDKLFRESVRLWDKFSEEEKAQAFAYAEEYRTFLNLARTERRTARFFQEKALSEGFVDLLGSGPRGKRVFLAQRGKIMALAVLGTRPMTDGARIITSHIDCPRLDLKPNSLYEDNGLALLKTHYYGGIKKFHWVARQLAIFGTIVKGDGSLLEISVGMEPGDPIFTIPDLLPHLSRKQMEQKASEFIPAENLNILAGGIPYPDKDTDERVKLAVLNLLNQKYGIVEEDFTTAELEITPAERAMDCGFDRSFLAGYGQDDRICAYTSFMATLETSEPEHTAIAVFYDKEEVGSEGNTSAKSNFLEMLLLELMALSGTEPTLRDYHKMLVNSKGLSADVTAGIDPNYQDVHEKRNAAKLGYGIGFKKYTGHGGKYMASDANSEHAAWLRSLFNKNGVVWQVSSLGKVDEGGGGTVAKYLANMGVDIIDCGPAILGMHSPMEVSSKDDIWMCHKAFKVFLGS
jgi:aspartyl aminopeptidase